MAIIRKANAQWRGTGLEGKGTLDSKSGFFKGTPYSHKTRFLNEDGTLGTNPEELVAAAHAGCFAMALSFGIVNAGHEAELLDVTATIKMEEDSTGFGFSLITLHLKGKVPGMSKEQFTELANGAKQNCPISKALKSIPIEMELEFEG